MRVAMYYNNRDVRVEEAEKPKVGDNEILVKAQACGVCGTDVLEWYRIKKAPLVLGHEMAGEVAEVGKNVSGYKVGDRVFVTHHVPCMECYYCHNGNHTACETLHTTKFYPGGFSEFIRIPEINVRLGTLKLPGSVSYEEATFIEPLATVVRGQRIAGVKAGQSVLIMGCGTSGLLHIMLAKFRGVKKILATNRGEYRRRVAERLGAAAIDPSAENVQERVRKLNKGRLADHVVVCTGSLEACKQAFQCVERGGTILFFAVPPPHDELAAPMNDLWRNEVKMMTSYAAAPYDLKESLDLIASGKIKVKDLITHRFGLTQAGEAFRITAEGKDSVKAIIEPQK